MNKLLALVLTVIISVLMTSIITAKEKLGAYVGAKTATHPIWFKDSFLDLEDDISDATEQSKRLVLYFWQPGCPYCAQLWDDNFAQKESVDTFRKNFEIIAINMWGNREVINVGGKNYTEKSFAEALPVAYTPTLLFFNEKKKVVLKLEGYIPSENFHLAMRYVSEHREKEGSYARFVVAEKEKKYKKKEGTLHNEPFFSKPIYDLAVKQPNEKDKGKYQAVFFEEPHCKPCDLLHQKTLHDKETLKLIKQFKATQLNRYAKTAVITPSGKVTTAKKWATQLNISYLPAIVFFDPKGKEVMRIDAQMRSFHIQSVFDYVLSKAYKTELSFQRYISARADKLREQGRNIDIWAY
ncbi:MAG: thioredoxin fold domain-containing protein [Cocleimonas sp.]|nr:thioredoxin fold domain-containing protein [Cocleimonas sp.]